MTGLDNLIYTALLNGLSEKEAKEKAMELLSRVGLAGQIHKKTGKYSRGMRQRLGLADVLIKNPEIIILDEPTSGIDPAGIQEFIELVRNLSRYIPSRYCFLPIIWIRCRKLATVWGYLIMGNCWRNSTSERWRKRKWNLLMFIITM